MTTSSMDLTSSNQVLEETSTNLITCMAPREWNSQHLADHFNSSTSYPKNSHVVLYIMWRLIHYSFGNRDVEFYPSEFTFECNSDSVTYSDTNLIQSSNDDEMYHLLYFFRTGRDDDIFVVDLQMLQE